MKIFVIHKSKDKAEAKRTLQAIKHDLDFRVTFKYVSTTSGANWKKDAKEIISDCELVLNFFADDFEKSPNVSWEIEFSKQNNKPIISFLKSDLTVNLKKQLEKFYNFEKEFEDCFPDGEEKIGTFELYKLMVETSEQLIQRRQLVNGFYLTLVIGLFAAIGFILEKGVVEKEQIFLVSIPCFVGTLICYSWRILLDNYGKLNTGKFAVIHKLERQLPARIFAAEWLALGNGKRAEKYSSFTKTEKLIPLILAFLFLALGLFFLL